MIAGIVSRRSQDVRQFRHALGNPPHLAFPPEAPIVCTVLGIAIATTGKVTDADINTAFSQAVQKAMEKEKK